LAWLKVQRKIARKGLLKEAGAFTVSMLELGPKVTKGLKGLSDAEDVHELAHWIAKHPKRELTPEQREALAARGKALMRFRMGKEALG
jgi:hypothetical protein